MNTPIADFVRDYEKKNMTRLHMPGHKGQLFLGCENYDLTEIYGADELYDAEGIIAESEKNASELFGSGRTVYSTEGSSQCIRGMLYLAISEWKRKYSKEYKGRPVVAAARNVHKAFVYAAALLDFDVVWLWPEQMDGSICSCRILPDTLRAVLEGLSAPPAAVYVTSPDYLGNQQDIEVLADICHEKGTILAVDNAHGAYLHFVEPKQHPMDLGADICCDSAHKTLPVLTGGAYLQISKAAPESFSKNAKQAMALFGSTSPSYLTLMSLDLCNQYLSTGYGENLCIISDKIKTLRKRLESFGWKTDGTEPMKLTVRMPKGISGIWMADKLRIENVECEFADQEYMVMMFTPENSDEDFKRVERALTGKMCCRELEPFLQSDTDAPKSLRQRNISEMGKTSKIDYYQSAMSIREAVFAQQEDIPVEEAVGRICGAVTVSCPPAIPIVVSGEVISETAAARFRHYGIEHVSVVLADGVSNVNDG